MYTHQNYMNALKYVEGEYLQNAKKVHSARWQGVDISKKPEMATFEALHVSFAVNMTTYGFNMEAVAEDVKPNMPWAEDHFLERVCGHPINPGTQWKKWPYGQSAAKFLEGGRFNHNYMERYWPRYANQGEYSKALDE